MKTLTKSLLIAGVLALGANGLAAATGDWANDWFSKKYGRNTPAVDARLKAEHERTAFREEGREVFAPAPTWIEQHFLAKWGRSAPHADARQRGTTADRAPEPGPARPDYIEQHFKGKLGRELPAFDR